jgi:D-alanyl-D-alanine carboxypeptidase
MNLGRRLRWLALVTAGATALGGTSIASAGASPRSARRADSALERAIERFVAARTAPGLAAVVQRGRKPVFHGAGSAVLGSDTVPKLEDHVRIASVAKAVTGAVALSVVARGRLRLQDTIAKRLPKLPRQWGKVTLTQLMQHTSGIPDFSASPSFGEALRKNLLNAPPPVELLSFVQRDPLLFRPGSKYHYSNSDNIIVGLMVEAATGRPFDAELKARVLGPLGLHETSLPNGATMPTPFVHGYDVSDPAAPEDVSEIFAAGWTWTSGGVVSTPNDANRFVRAYASGKVTNRATHARQLSFRPGSSEPPGPGKNSAGLSIFRYKTRCGTVYGHTGNTAGYTQFIAATRDGKRSVSVSVNAQVTPKTNAKGFEALRGIYELAVCAALA